MKINAGDSTIPATPLTVLRLALAGLTICVAAEPGAYSHRRPQRKCHGDNTPRQRGSSFIRRRCAAARALDSGLHANRRGCYASYRRGRRGWAEKLCAPGHARHRPLRIGRSDARRRLRSGDVRPARRFHTCQSGSDWNRVQTRLNRGEYRRRRLFRPIAGYDYSCP